MMKHRIPIIGIMGPGESASPEIIAQAHELGKRIAQNNWILLTGGRKAGVMDAASSGADSVGGIVLGILPGETPEGMSEHVTIPIKTGMGSARNIINILTADVIIICGMGLGTASEASLAIKHKKQVLFTMIDPGQLNFFDIHSKTSCKIINDIDGIIGKIEELL